MGKHIKNVKRPAMTGKRIFQISYAILLATLCSCAVRGGVSQTRLQKLNNSLCRDTETGLMWQIRPDKAILQSDVAAHQHVSELELGGYSDWRLPTYDELYVLHDALEIYKYNDCRMKQEVPVWYVDDKGETKAGHWFTDPTCGGVDYTFFKKKDGFVRAVRP